MTDKSVDLEVILFFFVFVRGSPVDGFPQAALPFDPSRFLHPHAKAALYVR
jgi:hypothetical protein